MKMATVRASGLSTALVVAQVVHSSTALAIVYGKVYCHSKICSATIHPWLDTGFISHGLLKINILQTFE